jgi:exopolysaccharide biosynthesis polyprenyl glycosylphosphotransferase
MVPVRRQLLANAFKAFDSLVLVGAFGVAALLSSAKLNLEALQDLLIARIKLQNFVVFLGLLSAWRLIFWGFGLYRTKRMAAPRHEVLDVAKATTAAALLLAVAAPVFDLEMVSVQFVVVFWLTAGGIIIASRLVLRRLLSRIRARGRNLRHVVIIGANAGALAYARLAEGDPGLGYRIIGLVDEGDGTQPGSVLRYPILGTLSEFSRILEKTVIDEVVICLPLRERYDEMSAIIAQCEEQGIVVRVQLDFPREGHMSQASQVVTLYSGAMSDAAVVVKRVVDLVVSAVAVVVTLPLWPIVAALIKLDSPGPVLFRQQRPGLNKRPFTMVKFRTMYVGAEGRLSEVAGRNEAGGPSFKVKDDPRVTRVGRWLRKMSLDELPQLLNVLRGEMSLVGPRPLFAWEFDRVEEAWIRRRCSVKPGLTGLWQVSGRSDLPFQKRIELDLHYIDNWSLEMDFRILARTVPAVMRGKGAL